MRSLLGIALLCLACGAQSGQGADAGPDMGQGEPLVYGDGAWVLVVDREWDRSLAEARFPHDPLTEAAYVALAEPTSVPLTVSGDGTRVDIGGDASLVGTRTAGEEGVATYDLGQGTFAGGRFVVWQQGVGLQAALTLYGSGVPIVQSQRGALVPQ